MASAFPRKLEMGGAPRLDAARAVGALLHLLIPVATFCWMNGYGLLFFERLGWKQIPEAIVADEGWGTVPLDDARMFLLLFLDIFYSNRWAFGMITMSGTVTMGTAIAVSLLHLVVHCLAVSGLSLFAKYRIDHEAKVLSIDGYPALNWVDAAGFALCIMGGVLQHGAESERYTFKKSSKNEGKLHTKGLFGYARFINHTGHVLRDVGAALLARSYALMAFTALSSYNLLGPVTQGTIAHLKTKYGAAQYAAYEKKTPALFLPGVY